ncbi:FG-GAP repeat domain-containing protein [Thiocapsa sp.]|uniref:FG-GAP repeat domain-containing protein n=1 Tax=Thiocapsa sp. TaxID=2024551 RepID=UPI003593F6F4
MRRLVKHRVAATLLTLLCLTSGTDIGTPAIAADPDFSQVPDILQGQRILLPVDDLVITAPSGLVGAGVTNLVLQTESSMINDQQSYPVTGSPVPSASTVIGRMLDLPRDVIVTMTEGLVNVTDQDHFGRGFAVSGAPRGMVMADFDGDGFADIALLTASSEGSTGGLLRILGANNVGNPDAGLFVSNGIGPPSINFDNPISITTGDMDGDGTPEVVIAQPFPVQGGRFLVQIYEVVLTSEGKIAPDALRQVASATFDSPAGNVIWSLEVVAGNFDGVVDPTSGLPTDELVLVINNGDQLTLEAFRAKPTSTKPLALDITVEQTYVSPDTLYTDGGTAGAPLLVASARLDWFDPDPTQFSPSPQIVVSYTRLIDPGGSTWESVVAVFGLDSALEITEKSSITTGEGLGMALGNFDGDVASGSSPNLEIALVTSELEGNLVKAAIQILSVDPADGFALSVTSNNPVDDLPPDFYEQVPLVAGDTQGRSLRLGSPNKVTINSYLQPEILLGAPPMHVAWAPPIGESTPVELNLTSVPNQFYAQYRQVDSQQSESKRASTTSFSYSTKETSETKVSFGVPLVASISATIKDAATQTHDTVVKNTFDTYSSRAFDAFTQTGFDDHVWFTGARLNIYYYPVIGHCIACAEDTGCPDAADGCPAGTRPLVVQFSGPDEVIHEDIDGANLEWYQPVHQVGNILSYPPDLGRLEPLIPRFNLLSPDPPTRFFTDTSGQTREATWAQGGSTQVTQGSTRTNSMDTSVSVSDSATAVGDFFTVGASGSASFSTNLSTSIATLNSTEATMDESTGVGIATAQTFLDPPSYQYGIDSLISGQEDPAGTLQTIDIDLEPKPTQQSTGILRAAFIADPTDTAAGPWWRNTYTVPDLGLNHPARWIRSTETSAPNQPPPSNCLRVQPGSSSMDCLAFRAPDPDDVTGSAFYWIKGLLVTPADAAADQPGPQVVQATVGDPLRLQVRVYNFSLADMPAGSEVRVRFYGQMYDNTTGKLEPGTGFLIAEEAYAPIPGFNSANADAEASNWILAETTFDTTDYSDRYLMFWVVVWGEEGSALMAELPDHGLTAIPAADLTDLPDVAIEGHSNNLGFYRQPIFIAPQTSQDEVEAVMTATETDLIVETVDLVPSLVDQHREVKIAVTLRNGARPVDSISVFFYDDDPLAGGKAFDHELIPHLRAHDIFTLEVPYRPRTCGWRPVHVVAQSPGAASAQGMAVLDVRCSIPTVHFPSGPGVVLKTGEPVTLSWQGFSGPWVKIDLYDGAALVGPVGYTGIVPNTGSYTRVVPHSLRAGDDYRIKISSLRDRSQVDFSDSPFGIEPGPPPTVLFPSDAGITVVQGDTVEITWTGFSAPRVAIDLLKGGLFVSRISGSITVANGGSYLWTIPRGRLRPSDDYRIRIRTPLDPPEIDVSDNPFTILPFSGFAR